MPRWHLVHLLRLVPASVVLLQAASVARRPDLVARRVDSVARRLHLGVVVRRLAFMPVRLPAPASAVFLVPASVLVLFALALLELAASAAVVLPTSLNAVVRRGSRPAAAVFRVVLRALPTAALRRTLTAAP